jgi:hypothetical protein
MTRHVGDDHPETVVIQLDELIEVPGNRGHGMIAGRDAEPGQGGHVLGENGKLNLVCRSGKGKASE